MNLGNSLHSARKKAALSQEAVAEKLGVSRQTISKWELGETLPDIRQSKELAVLYRLSLDELIDFDADLKEIEDVIDRTSEEKQKQIDWTALWAKKYPILTAYQKEVDTSSYKSTLQELLTRLQTTHNYTPEDSFLVLKDILSKLWSKQK